MNVLEDNLIEKIIEDLSRLSVINRAFETMYHYTSPNNITNILNKDNIQLRFTRFDCVNDTSEGKYAYDVFTEVCRGLNKNKKITNEYCNFLLELITDEANNKYIAHSNETLQRIIGHKVKKGNGYICCFSKNHDSLPMWNYYVKNESYRGVNIGLHSNKLRYSLEGVPVSLYNVVYKESELKRLFSEKIIAYRKYFSNKDVNAKSNIACYIYVLINIMKYIAKKQCFEHENEVRAIFFLDESQRGLKQEFDWTRGFAIPYIKLTFNKDAFYMLNTGPLIDSELAINNAKEYLNSCGYRKAVDVSKVPIRF